VGNGGIGWLVTIQKYRNFLTQRNCMIQGNMACNGLGNRCLALALPEATIRKRGLLRTVVSNGRVKYGHAHSDSAGCVELVGITSATKNKVRQIHTTMLGQPIGHYLPLVEKRRIVRSFFLLLAEREDATITAKTMIELAFQLRYFPGLQITLQVRRCQTRDELDWASGQSLLSE
jgi:hypothetical protein